MALDIHQKVHQNATISDLDNIINTKTLSNLSLHFICRIAVVFVFLIFSNKMLLIQTPTSSVYFALASMYSPHKMIVRFIIQFYGFFSKFDDKNITRKYNENDKNITLIFT